MSKTRAAPTKNKHWLKLNVNVVVCTHNESMNGVEVVVCDDSGVVMRAMAGLTKKGSDPQVAE
ncbi:hypothetical protein PanWU01x14_337770 [Parasponia andersonii]|uniref:Uncharacterized protein n=1 Tax=Parasponia andersonii TaxID=3476 RepID=A0A2P5AFE2_PARAD|nr:hypothetical protein PanWU01x14_337770 [Parasponia andersonii]